MRVKEKLIGIMGTAQPRLVSRLVTFGVGLAIVAVVATGAVAVGGGAGTLQQAYAQEACPEGYTFNGGLCTAEPIPGEEGSDPTCPETGNFREPEIVNGQCQVRPGEGEPEPGDDEVEEEVEEDDEVEEEVEEDDEVEEEV